MTEQQENYEAWKDSFRESAGEIRCGKADEHGTRRCTVCNEIMPMYTIHSHETPFSAYDQDKFTYKDGKLERNQEELQTARSINDTLKQRGSVYGSFEAQAKCVGRIIKACNDVSMQNHEQALANIQLGSIAYIAIKLARFANGETGDTLHDLHGYSKLIDELYNGDKNV